MPLLLMRLGVMVLLAMLVVIVILNLLGLASFSEDLTFFKISSQQNESYCNHMDFYMGIIIAIISICHCSYQ